LNVGEEIPDDDETYNVEISLKRVAILYSCHNLNQWGLFESLYKDIEDCQSGNIGDRGIPVPVR
jgi:cohesin complex subunit SA-1/2